MAVTIEVTGDNLEHKELQCMWLPTVCAPSAQTRILAKLLPTVFWNTEASASKHSLSKQAFLTWSSVYARMPFRGPSAAAFTTLLMSSYLA